MTLSNTPETAFANCQLRRETADAYSAYGILLFATAAWATEEHTVHRAAPNHKSCNAPFWHLVNAAAFKHLSQLCLHLLGAWLLGPAPGRG